MTAVNIPIELDEPFRFTVGAKKKVWELPSLDDLPFGARSTIGAAMRRAKNAEKAGRKPSEADITTVETTQRKLFEEYCPGLIDTIPVKAFQELCAKWAEHSGTDLGES